MTKKKKVLSASPPHRNPTFQQVYEERIHLATLLREHAKQAETELYRIRPAIEDLPPEHAVEKWFRLALLETSVWKRLAKWMLRAFNESRPAPAAAHITLAQRWEPLTKWSPGLLQQTEEKAANLRHAVHHVCKGLKQLPAALRRAVDEHGQKSQPKGPVCGDEAGGDSKSACPIDHPRVQEKTMKLSDTLFADLQTSRGELLLGSIKKLAREGNHGDEPPFATLGRYCPDPVVQRRALRALVACCLEQDQSTEFARLEELDRLSVMENARSLTPAEATKKIGNILWTFGDTDRVSTSPQVVEMAEIVIAVPEVIPVLLEGYQSNAHLRAPIGEALRQVREGREAVEAKIRAFLSSPDAVLRMDALVWLDLSGRLTLDLLPHCIAMCREASPDEWIVWLWLSKLGKDHPEAVVAGLLPALTTDDWDFLDNVGDVFAFVVVRGSPPVREWMRAEIAKMLAHPEAGLRATGLFAVGWLKKSGWTVFLDKIEALRDDVDPEIAELATEVASRLRK